MSLSEANALIGSLDEATVSEDGYYKTKFRIDFVMDGQPDNYIGRQDLGDGDGTLIEHIEGYHAYYENNADWDNYVLQGGGTEALEADKAQREMLLHEFVPYLKLHNNLSKMEQAATKAQNFLLENPLKTAELSTEQNANMIDGIINNTPAADGLEAAAGEQISLEQYAETLKQDEAQKNAGQEQDTTSLTELQQKAAEIAKGYEKLSMQERIDIIA